jgi:uncharacterized protein
MMNTRPIAENGLVGDLFHDGSGQPCKAIVMLGGSEGGKTWSGISVRKPVSHLVGLGYTLLTLAYFKAPGLPTTCENIPLEYFEQGFTWLAHQPEVASDEIALLGGSKGGEVSLLLASMNSKIKSVIAFSPSSVVWQGIPKMGADISSTKRSSWTYRGQELPFVPFEFTSWNRGTMLATLLFGKLRHEHEKSLQNPFAVEQAVIPVEKIQAAILLFSGRRDQMWPSTEMCEQIMSRLKANGFSYPMNHISYDSGHNGYMLKKEVWMTIGDFLKTNYAP